MSQSSPAVRADRPTLTIGVLTKNEAHRIENCLRSAAFADQVVVVDSGSTDDTVAIARRLGAEVHLYPDWQGFAVQRTRLLAHATGDLPRLQVLAERLAETYGHAWAPLAQRKGRIARRRGDMRP